MSLRQPSLDAMRVVHVAANSALMVARFSFARNLTNVTRLNKFVAADRACILFAFPLRDVDSRKLLHLEFETRSSWGTRGTRWTFRRRRSSRSRVFHSRGFNSDRSRRFVRFTDHSQFGATARESTPCPGGHGERHHWGLKYRRITSNNDGIESRAVGIVVVHGYMCTPTMPGTGKTASQIAMSAQFGNHLRKMLILERERPFD
jgi:hypothetical protein